MEQVPLVPGYEVLEPLGQGASATVWRARRRGDGLVVALKVLTPAGGDVAAGLREAGLLAGVRHQHVVRLYDVIPLPDPDTGRPTALAMATQLAAGGSLAQVLSRRRILSAGELVTALQPVAGALADLHGQGVVHGDLSSGNVLFLTDGMPLLADLGAARVTGAPSGDPQGTGAASGMVAPEVVEGFPATQESDVYQLGAVAWLCLAGRPPGPPWSRGTLEELAPGLPAGLADLVTRCLAPEPADRPDAEEVALALLATAPPQPIEVAPDADPVHSLTERLRQLAKEDLTPKPAEQAAWWRRMWPRRAVRPRGGRSGSHRPERDPAAARRSRQPVAVAADRSRTGGLRRTGLLAWSVAAVVVLAAVVAIGSTIVVPRMGPDLAGLVTSAQPGQGPPASAAAPTPAAPPPAPEKAAAGEADVRASTDDVATTLQDLVDGRGAAWESADPGQLSAVMAPGSPALESEQVQLERVREEGLHYDDVTFRVDEASVVGDTGSRLTVDATVTREPLRGRLGSGTELVTSQTRTDRVQVVLASVDGRWMLWSWG